MTLSEQLEARVDMVGRRDEMSAASVPFSMCVGVDESPLAFL